jgi:membrane protease YdiL (CAAX protease family)
MTDTTKPGGNSKNIVLFFVLAFVFSWSIGIPLALAKQGSIQPILPDWAHYLTAFAPLLSVLIVSLVSQGLSGLKDLGNRVTRLACPKWIVFSLSPIIIGFIVIKILNGFTGSEISFSTLGAVNYLPPLGAWAILFWILTFGLGGEVGLRGFALPILQKRYSSLTVALILALFWGIWQLPQFFYLVDPPNIFIWLVGLFAGSVILTWFYNSAANSILLVSVWFGCYQFITASTADTGLLPILMTLMIAAWALFVIKRYDPKHLITL